VTNECPEIGSDTFGVVVFEKPEGKRKERKVERKRKIMQKRKKDGR
jgi:hypothetical protein